MVFVCCIVAFAFTVPAQAYDGRLVSMAVSPNPVQTGRPFTVTITAANSSAPQYGGMRWDVEGASVEILSAVCPQGLIENLGGGGECLGMIPQGQTLTMTVTAMVDAPGKYTHTATVFPTPDLTPADDTMTGSFVSVGNGPEEGGESGGRRGAGRGGEPSSTSAPRLSSLTIAPATFHAASKGAVFARASSSRAAARATPTGALVTFVADQNTTARFGVLRAASGRIVGSRCVAPTRSNARKRACVRYLALPGTVAVNAVGGTNRLRFSGRWQGRKLRPGRYQLALALTNASGQKAASRRVTFTIV